MIEYQRYRLANGVRVIYVRTPGLHTAIAVAYLKMGPRYERPAESGLAHFVEHMVFKGTEHYADAESLSKEMDGIGAYHNGATNAEYTELLVSCHRRHCRRAVDLLAEIVLRPRFDPSHVEMERRVLLEEIGQLRDLLGEDVGIDELSYELMWPSQGHRFSALGSEANVARFTRDDLVAHYARFLNGGNVVVCVAGDLQEAEVVDHVAACFGGLARGEAARCPVLADGQQRPRMLFRRARTRMLYLRLCHKACSYHDPRFRAALVLSDVLGGGASSRLFARLREREGLVYDVSAHLAPFCDCGWVDIATTTSPRSGEATVAGLVDEVGRLAEQGVDEAQLQGIKDRAACQMEMLEDSPVDVADWFGVRELLLEPEQLQSPTAEAERLKSVTAEEVRAVAGQLFLPGRRALVVVGPTSWAQRRRIRALLDR